MFKTSLVFKQDAKSNKMFNWLKANVGELSVDWDITDITMQTFRIQFKSEKAATMCALLFTE